MLILIGAVVVVAVLALGVLFMRRRTADVAEELPDEGLSEEEVASLQRKQRSHERSIRVKRGER
jgi:hypothetical protein